MWIQNLSLPLLFFCMRYDQSTADTSAVSYTTSAAEDMKRTTSTTATITTAATTTIAAAVVQQSTTSLEYREGDSADIECPIEGGDAAKPYRYFWFSPNDEVVQEDDRGKRVYTRRELINSANRSTILVLNLIFTHFDSIDSGQYSCAAKDKAGDISVIKRVVSIKVLSNENSSESTKDKGLNDITKPPEAVKLTKSANVLSRSSAIPLYSAMSSASQKVQKVLSVNFDHKESAEQAATALTRERRHSQPVFTTMSVQIADSAISVPLTTLTQNQTLFNRNANFPKSSQAISGRHTSAVSATTLQFLYDRDINSNTDQPSPTQPLPLLSTAGTIHNPDIPGLPTERAPRNVTTEFPTIRDDRKATKAIENNKFDENIKKQLETSLPLSNENRQDEQEIMKIGKSVDKLAEETDLHVSTTIFQRGKTNMESNNDLESLSWIETTDTTSSTISVSVNIASMVTDLPSTDRQPTTTIVSPSPSNPSLTSPSFTTTEHQAFPSRPVMVTFDEDYHSIIPGQEVDNEVDSTADSLLKSNSAGLILGIAVAAVLTGICAAVAIHTLRARRRKSKYIAFGNPSYNREHLPANDACLDHNITLSSHGYTVLA